MSIEKSYRLIPRELSIEYSAYESGLDRFVHPNKGDFIGRDALVDWPRARASNWNFVTLEVHGVTDADARGSEPIYARRQARRPRHQWRLRLAGRQIAGARHGQARTCRDGTELEIKILGKLYKATVIGESPFDPDNNALRADA